MAIQMRRGAYANLDKSKLVAGEIVMSTDTNYVGIAKAPSQVLQLATTDMLELPVASTNTLGGVKVGDNLSIDSNGRLSATGGGGGTTVIANPTGTATDDLTKIQIGQTIYDIEGGGGSGAGYTKELVYDSGSDTTYAPVSSAVNTYDVDVSFTKSVYDYDQLLVVFSAINDGSYTFSGRLAFFDVELLKTDRAFCWSDYYCRWFQFKLTSQTTFSYFSAAANENNEGYRPRIFKIYGIKFGGGSSGIPIASATTLGGVKVGNNLSIDSSGVLSATGGGGSSVVPNPIMPASDELETVGIDGTVYRIGHATTNRPSAEQTLMYFGNNQWTYQYTFYGSEYEYSDFALTLSQEDLPRGKKTLTTFPLSRIRSYPIQLIGSVHLTVNGIPLYFATPMGSTVTLPASIYDEFSGLDVVLHFWLGQDTDDTSKAALYFEADRYVATDDTVNVAGWFTIIS